MCTRTALAVVVLVSWWTIAGCAQESEASNERDLARLLGRSLSASAVDENGWTDLRYAAVLNLPRLAATLSGTGARADAIIKTDGERLGDRLKTVLHSLGRDTFDNYRRRGQTPLYLAAWEGSSDVAKLLLDRGADVNALDSSGIARLHVAANRTNLDVAAILVAGPPPTQIGSEIWQLCI